MRVEEFDCACCGGCIFGEFCCDLNAIGIPDPLFVYWTIIMDDVDNPGPVEVANDTVELAWDAELCQWAGSGSCGTNTLDFVINCTPGFGLYITVTSPDDSYNEILIQNDCDPVDLEAETGVQLSTDGFVVICDDTFGDFIGKNTEYHFTFAVTE